MKREALASLAYWLMFVVGMALAVAGFTLLGMLLESGARGHDVRLPEAVTPVWIGIHHDGAPPMPFGVEARSLDGAGGALGYDAVPPDIRPGQTIALSGTMTRRKWLAVRVIAVDRWHGGWSPQCLSPRDVRDIDWNALWPAPCEPEYHYPLSMGE